MGRFGVGKFAGLAVALLGLVTACGLREGPPNLLETLAFYPNAGSRGDTLHVIGPSFPEGRHATLTFRGTLFRAGERPLHDVVIEAPALRVAKNSLDVALSAALEAEFCGEGARHTTFRGEVVAAFAARINGAAPVTGRVPGVVLDVRPTPLSARETRQNTAEGQRFSQFLGVDLTRPGERERFQVTGVVPDGRAERAGLAPGDTLLSLDGVTLEAWEDFVPSGYERLSELTVDRPNAAHALQLVLDVEGFKSVTRAELWPATFGVLLFSLTLLLSRGPLGRALSFFERQWFAARHAEREQRAQPGLPERSALATTSNTRRRLERLLSLLASALPTSLWLRALACCAAVGVSLVFAGISLGLSFIDPELDLGLLFVASAIVASGVMASVGGWEGQSTWSLGRGLVRAAELLALQVPVLAALGCVGLVSGSLRAEALLGLQGGYPWQWRVFFSPVFLLLSTLSIACLLPRGAADKALIPEALGDTAGPRREAPLQALARLTELVHLGVSAGVLANLFFGGWRLPGVSLTAPTQALQLSARLSATLLLQLKIALLVLLIVGLRRLLPKIYVSQVSVWIWRGVVPLSVGALFACAAWTSAVELPALRRVETLVAPLLFATSLSVIAFMLVRLLGKSKAPLQNHANPWL